MNLLQVIFIVSGIIMLLLSLDILGRKKFNAFHALIFASVGGGLLLFTLFPHILDLFGHVFGLQRGADVLVYASVIILFYFVLLLLNKAEKNREDVTRLIRELALLEESLRSHRVSEESKK